MAKNFSLQLFFFLQQTHYVLACPFFGDADATLLAGRLARLAQRMHWLTCLGSHTYDTTVRVKKRWGERRRRGVKGCGRMVGRDEDQSDGCQ